MLDGRAIESEEVLPFFHTNGSLRICSLATSLCVHTRVAVEKDEEGTYVYDKGGDVMELNVVSCVDANTVISSSMWFLLAKSDITRCSLLLKIISVEEDLIVQAMLLTGMNEYCSEKQKK